MKTELLILAGVASLAVAFLNEKNKKKREEVRERMRKKAENQKVIKAVQESKYKNHEITSLIIELIEESNFHHNIGRKLSDEEILNIEKRLKINLPLSYKIFLQYFGDGAYWVFTQSIDSIKNASWLEDFRKDLDKTIQLEDKYFNVDTLLCLMSEDSNGGAWVWLTSEKKENNEWSLAYYSIQDKKLHYKVENFTEWLKILVKNKDEVIRFLDIEYKLGLG